MRAFIYFASIIHLILRILALDNGLGLTPPMGWNSWNHFGCNITEEVIRQTADKIVSTGLARLGYIYVNIDDCWQKSRDENGKIAADKEKFPSGIKSLSDYIHSLGLKFGLYSDAGFWTCQRRPGSLHHEEADAQTYAEWEVDFLKYDNCYNDLSSPKKRYPVMRDALNKTGRPIFFSMCEWGRFNPATWAREVGNSWRTTLDISDKWHRFKTILDKQYGLEVYAGKGGWNDPDMLEVGNGGMTHNEYQAHFALWALLKAPLILGFNFDKVSEQDLKIVMNEDLISINQDPLGKQGKRVMRQFTITGYIEVYHGELIDGHAIILFNRSWYTQKIQAKLKDYGVKPGTYSAKNMYTGQQLDNFIIKPEEEYIYTGEVPTHSVECLKLTLLSEQLEFLQ